ncbi:hypothetical protein A4W78_06530 [Latilactobacillus curvatus]|nr:hypothetical protein A4W78_06530 [Latilactobacillus curvatus]
MTAREAVAACVDKMVKWGRGRWTLILIKWLSVEKRTMLMTKKLAADHCLKPSKPSVTMVVKVIIL